MASIDNETVSASRRIDKDYASNPYCGPPKWDSAPAVDFRPRLKKLVKHARYMIHVLNDQIQQGLGRSKKPSLR